VEEHPEYGYLGLSVADTPERAKAFLAEKGWEWPQIKDPNRELARRLGATYQPYVALLDERGKIVATLDGRGDEKLWEAMLQQLPSD
jgi:AhpC/TSA family